MLAEFSNIIEDFILLRRIDEAESMIERHCAHAERIRSATPEPLVRCLGQRADLLGQRGRHAAAAQEHEAAMIAGTALYGAAHPETGALILTYGQASVDAGEPTRGCAELQRALTVWRESLDETHPEIRNGEAMVDRACRDSGQSRATPAR